MTPPSPAVAMLWKACVTSWSQSWLVLNCKRGAKRRADQGEVLRGEGPEGATVESVGARGAGSTPTLLLTERQSAMAAAHSSKSMSPRCCRSTCSSSCSASLADRLKWPSCSAALSCTRGQGGGRGGAGEEGADQPFATVLGRVHIDELQ